LLLLIQLQLSATTETFAEENINIPTAIIKIANPFVYSNGIICHNSHHHIDSIGKFTIDTE
jgi:hypothetical protein